MHLKVKNRYIAASIHFGISLLIFSAFILALLFLWYPAPYFSASGGWQGLRIVAAVDLILGPLLTLVVFNLKKTKKELLLDLSLIFFMQLSALSWGVYQVYQQRPVATVFWDTRFYTVPAQALISQGIDPDIVKQYGSGSPVYIYAQKPESVEKWYALVREMNETDTPPHHMVELYRPLDEHYDDIYQYSDDIEEIMASNESMREDINEVLANSGTDLTDNHYLKLESRYRNIILVFDRNNKLIGTASAPYKEKGEI